MNHHPYSYSKIKKYKECPFKFKTRYIDGVKGPDTPPLVEGRAYHLFTFHLDSARLKARDPRPDMKLARELIKQDIEPISPYTTPERYSSLVELCKKYASRELVIDHLVGLERQWAFTRDNSECDYDHPNAFFRGAWDILYVDSGLATVIDRKTSSRATADKFQMEVYGWSVLKLFPQVQEVLAIFDYDKLGWSEKKAFQHSDLVSIEESIYALIYRLEGDNEFKPTPSDDSCRWCDYWSLCPAMKGKKKQQIIKAPANQQELENLVAELIGTEKSREAILNVLKEYVEIFGPASAMGRRFYNSTTETWKGIDVLDLMVELKKIQKLEWWNALGINWKGLRKLANENEEVKELLGKMGEHSLTERFTSSKA